MQLIPAVDLLGDDAVRLLRGDYARPILNRDPETYISSVAKTDPPLIHLVDLDGARDGRIRLDRVAACIAAAGAVPVQVSGGVRTVADAVAVMALGATRVIVGTAAFGRDDTLQALVDELDGQIAVAIDVKAGRVAVGGWLADTDLSAEDAAERCVRFGVGRVLATSIDRDGTVEGPDLDLYRRLCRFPLKVMAAGGVRNPSDVAALADVGCEAAISGRAFAEGRFDA
jgi:phosphoribosylformimino-5-aminoimidazole carboxamide ribotide isomerase